MRIFLIGYMGAGKTTVGTLLANKLNWTFIDIDCFIENRYHKTITSIFEEKGEIGFREIEHRTLQEISGFEKVVISTGGGLPCFFNNMDLMNQSGITIYLRSSVGELISRINFEKQKRPLVKNKSQEELLDFVETSLIDREKYYNNAKIIFDIPHFHSKKEMNEWVEEILESIL